MPRGAGQRRGRRAGRRQRRGPAGPGSARSARRRGSCRGTRRVPPRAARPARTPPAGRRRRARRHWPGRASGHPRRSARPARGWRPRPAGSASPARSGRGPGQRRRPCRTPPTAPHAAVPVAGRGGPRPAAGVGTARRRQPAPPTARRPSSVPTIRRRSPTGPPPSATPTCRCRPRPARQLPHRRRGCARRARPEPAARARGPAVSRRVGLQTWSTSSLVDTGFWNLFSQRTATPRQSVGKGRSRPCPQSLSARRTRIGATRAIVSKSASTCSTVRPYWVCTSGRSLRPPGAAPSGYGHTSWRLSLREMRRSSRLFVI